jgi:hypothetical protein
MIITDSLSTLPAINGNNHTKNPKTIKLREIDRNKKKDKTPVGTRTHGHTRNTNTQMMKQRQRWMMTYNKTKNTPPKDLEK